MNSKWYAVMTDRDDNDWGYGSFDRAEAEQMIVGYYPDGYIAVIENDVCVEEIEQADFISIKIPVTFDSGVSRAVRDGECYGVDYMIARIGDIELYAEMENPTWDDEKESYGDEWATYDDLKAEIIAQAEEKGISPDWLVFE